ncbi:MAG: DUF2271 domain-containing protein [Rikenellaceae bacterium]|nr:DUF2271 domain-containing protein [Rikenellaceae bacterium]
MKTAFLLFVMLAGIAASAADNPQVVITFTYERQAGPGSNQFAVYIEDEAGEIVRTLYVTSFTAEGGYVRRPACTPLWVSKSNVAEMASSHIDAVSGPTPQSGIQKYVWDSCDDKGRRVPDGKYHFVVESTYWGDNQAVFRGSITVGGSAATVEAPGEYNTDEEKNRGMISGVYAEYIP